MSTGDNFPQDQVKLGSNWYCIEGGVNVQGATEMAPKIVLGDESYDRRENTSILPLENWSGGQGQLKGKTKEILGTYWHGKDVDARFPNQLTLGPLAEDLKTGLATRALVTTDRAYFATFGGKDYFALADRVWQNNSGTVTEVLDIGNGPIGGMTTYVANSDGTARIYVFSVTENFRYSTDGSTWSNSGLRGRMGFEYERHLLVVDRDGTTFGGVDKSLNGTSFVSGDPIFNLKSPATILVNGIVYKNARGRLIPYVWVVDTSGSLTSGLWSVDFDAKKGYPISLGRLPRRGYRLNEPGFGMCVWNDSLYVSDSNVVLRYDPQGNTAPVGPREHGLPAGYGYFGQLFDTPRFLYACVGSGSTHGIMAFNGNGWHMIYTSTTPIRGIYVSTVHDPARLYFIEGGDGETATTKIRYITLSAESENPILDSNYKYAASGYLITPWFDGGYHNLTKTLKRVTLIGENLSSDEKVTITYQTNYSGGGDGGTWTDIESGSNDFTASGQEKEFGSSGVGVACKAFRFKIALARGSTNTKTPIVHAIVLDYQVRVRFRSVRTFIVDIGRTVREAIGRRVGSVRPDEIVSELKTAFDSETDVMFQYGNDTAVPVEVISIPHVVYHDGRDKDGSVQVQVMETIAP